MASSVQYDREKLREAVHYTCHKCDTSRLGATKLHKVLYFADMIKYASEGAPITGAVYRKRPYGPTCDDLLRILPEMERQGLILIEEVDYFGYTKRQYTSATAPVLRRLGANELALLDEVIDFVCERNTARTISEFSHSKPWEIVEFGDELPYRGAYSLFPSVVSVDTIEWASDEIATIAETRSAQDPMGHEDYASFRSRLYQKRRAV